MYTKLNEGKAHSVIVSSTSEYPRVAIIQTISRCDNAVWLYNMGNPFDVKLEL